MITVQESFISGTLETGRRCAYDGNGLMLWVSEVLPDGVMMRYAWNGNVKEIYVPKFGPAKDTTIRLRNLWLCRGFVEE